MKIIWRNIRPTENVYKYKVAKTGGTGPSTLGPSTFYFDYETIIMTRLCNALNKLKIYIHVASQSDEERQLMNRTQ